MRLIIPLVLMALLWPVPATAGEELRILSGARVIPDSIIERFERESGIRLRIEYFESPETLAAYLESRPRGDVALLREYHLKHLVDNDQLAPLNQALLPGLKNLNLKAFNSQADPDCRYSIPYAIGRLGIIYRSDLLTGDLDSWSWLFTQHAQAVPFALSNQYRDVMCAALISQGFSCNSTSPLALGRTDEILSQMERHPAFIGFLDVESMLLYLKERIIYVACTYDNVAVQAMAQDPGLAFTLPRDGAISWSLLFVVNKKSQNLKAAHQWLEFILEPAVSAEISETYLMATPNQAAWNYLPPSLKENQMIYPPSNQAQNLQTPLGLDDETEKLYISYWLRLRR